MLDKLAIALLLAAAFSLPAGAQMRIAAMGRVSVPGRAAASGFRTHAGAQRGQRSPLFLGDPFFYGDDFSTPVEPEVPAPQVLIMQAPPPAVEAPKEPRPEPLLIELQGDRYVRVNAAERSASAGYAPTDYAQPQSKSGPQPAIQAASPAALAPAVLVYRDGHQQELRDYTIANGVIYARGDYWVDGYWNKQIPLTALNLPATLKASADHGVNFVLPRSPNEVITRP